jgi:hypothetical protein
VQRNAFVEAVTLSMKCEVLGSHANPSQWRFPWKEDEKKTVKKENLTNPRSRKYIAGLGAFLLG